VCAYHFHDLTVKPHSFLLLLFGVNDNIELIGQNIKYSLGMYRNLPRKIKTKTIKINKNDFKCQVQVGNGFQIAYYEFMAQFI
jgi:hypothetical protein